MCSEYVDLSTRAKSRTAHTRRCMPAAIAILCLPFARPVAAQLYTITDLGSLVPRGIAERGPNGQVIIAGGYWGLTHALTWTNGTVADLGVLPGGNLSNAFAISPDGITIVGASNVSNGSYRAVTAENGMYNLGTLPGGSFSSAQAVSGNHRIVGMSGTSSGGEHGFFYADHMLDIGTLRGGTWSAAFGINDSNIIVGDGDDAGGRTRALLWDTSFNVFDLATLPGGSNSRALAINNGGVVVGISEIPGSVKMYPAHAFRYNGVMTDLGTLGGKDSSALAINSNGAIVGSADTANGINHAFLYDQQGMKDLNTRIPANSGWEFLASATAINDYGNIVGTGTLGGWEHGFLLSPVKTGMRVASRSVLGSQSAEATISLNQEVPWEVVVLLTSTNPAAIVPVSIAFPAGTLAQTFTIHTSFVETSVTTEIIAEYGGLSSSAALLIEPIL